MDAVRGAAGYVDPMLRTERLALRLLERDDLDRIVDLDSDPEVMRHVTGGVLLPRALHETVVLDRMLSFRRDVPERGFFGAWWGSTFVGWFHLRPDIFEPSWLELGYRLHRRFWGQGLATEGARALLEHARRDEPDTVLSARAAESNLASRRVIEKLGLSYAGDFLWPARTLRTPPSHRAASAPAPPTPASAERVPVAAEHRGAEEARPTGPEASEIEVRLPELRCVLYRTPSADRA